MQRGRGVYRMRQLTVSYLRVSTANQRDADTIATQRHALASYCEANSITVDQSFEDDGVSGGVEFGKRPSGGELFKLISSGRVKTLLLFHADRIGRDAIDSLLFHRLAENLGVAIIGVADGTDTRREGAALTTEIKTIIAAEYRRDCTRRTKAGLRRRAANGKISTHPPFGYVAQNGFLVIDEPRAEIVRQMFARVAQGERTRAVVQWLNERNAPSPRGNGWRCDTFLALLKNRTYAGEFVAFRTPRKQAQGGKRIQRDPSEQIIIPCPAIIPQELFALVQNRIAFNRLWCSTSRKNFYLLKSLIRCGDCGKGYVGHTVSGRRYKERAYPDVAYYECGSLTNRDYEFCGNVRLRASEIERAVWDQIESFISSPTEIIERLRASYNQQVTSGSQSTTRKLKRVRDQKTKNQQARERLTLAVARGIVTDDDALRAQETLTRELADLEKQETQLTDAHAETESHQRRLLDAQGLLAALRVRLDEGLSPDKRAEIARCLVRQITVKKGEGKQARVSVQYVFPSPFSFSPVGSALAYTTSQQQQAIVTEQINL